MPTEGASVIPFRVLSRKKMWQEIMCCFRIDHFTVVCLVTWLLNSSEAAVDFVLIETSLLLLCESSYSYANYLVFT